MLVREAHQDNPDYDVPESPVTFEVCPGCAQRTAFFRTVKKMRLCNLCACRAAASARALIEDRQIHGGSGWLWSDIFKVVIRTLRGF